MDRMGKHTRVLFYILTLRMIFSSVAVFTIFHASVFRWEKSLFNKQTGLIVRTRDAKTQLDKRHAAENRLY